MKNNILSASVLTSSLFLSFAHAHAATVMFEIEGIKNDAGKIYISLFKGKDNYKKGIAEAAQIVSPKKGTKQVVFEELSEGEYAIKYFHDENNDRKLDTNIFGSPTEGYGFSNDAKPNFGPASYDDMAFKVKVGVRQVKNTSTVIYK